MSWVVCEPPRLESRLTTLLPDTSLRSPGNPKFEGSAYYCRTRWAMRLLQATPRHESQKKLHQTLSLSDVQTKSVKSARLPVKRTMARLWACCLNKTQHFEQTFQAVEPKPEQVTGPPVARKLERRKTIGKLNF